MKLSEYKPEENCDTNKKSHEKKVEENKSIEEMYNIYKNFSQDELTNELFKNIAKQKSDGTFDYEKINQTISQVLPYLNENQKNNLMTILQKIK